MEELPPWDGSHSNCPRDIPGRVICISCLAHFRRKQEIITCPNWKHPLSSGGKKGAPDYDDWELNGDIIVYYPVLDIALELSSMGIRVDEESLKSQLKTAGCEDRAKLPFQKSLLDGELPYTVGGGIGQSRICMYYLRKAHIGEVQSSLWPDDVAEKAAAGGIQLL